MELFDSHLTYCANVHPGEQWDEMFNNLKKYVPSIRSHVSPDKPFGLGLWISGRASMELLHHDRLQELKQWLKENNLYVFTLNGFPYGNFHTQVVKDKVHVPDWQEEERMQYTLRLCKILACLLDENKEGSISTSPLSYKPWIKDPMDVSKIFKKSIDHLSMIILDLYNLYKEKNILIHIDIEPEPDGLIENSSEFINFFLDRLIPDATPFLMKEAGMTAAEAEQAIRQHIRLCFDVCHFAVGFEKPEQVFQKLSDAGIRIGKIQISSAIRTEIPSDDFEKKSKAEELSIFAENIYLHQVIARNSENQLKQFSDLSFALDEIQNQEMDEWRIHFHVPLFCESYGNIGSTQKEVIEALDYLRKNKICNHLEVETYTWDVLPPPLKLDLASSVARELQWVIKQLSL